jgi:acyl-CoA thioesterase YciA
VVAAKRARGRTVTVAMDALRFHKPVFVGDVVSCYAKIVRVGTTSIGIHVDTWVSRSAGSESYRVTEGILTFVAVAEDGRPRPLPPEDKAGGPN